MSDLPQGAARERVGSVVNPSGFAVAINAVSVYFKRLTTSNRQSRV